MIITKKYLDSILNTDIDTLRKKPVPSPSAQTTTLLQLQEQESIVMSSIRSYRFQLLRDDPLLWYIIELQLSGGLRISEVLGLSCKDISFSGHVSIKGSKGSYGKIIYVVDSLEYLLRCKNNSLNPFEGYSRFYVYRQFKKLGIELQLNGKKKNAVTHAIRHVVAREEKNAGFSKKQTQRHLGHRNSKSTDHYRGN